MMEWLAGLTAPVAYFALRRAPYLACYGYGMMLATQEGITIERQAAFDKGRTAILQNAANAAATAWRSADWALVWTGLLFWRHKIHEAAADTWRGVKRDATLVWTWMHGRLEPKESAPKPESAEAIETLNAFAPLIGTADPRAADAAVAVSGTLFDLERRRAVLARSLADPSTQSTHADVLEHTHILERLAQHYMANPADAAAMSMQRGLLSDANRPQALFGPVAALAGGLSWKLTAASVGVAVILGGLWRLEVAHSDKLEEAAKQYQANEQAYAHGLEARDAALAQRDARINATAQQCNTQIEEAQSVALKAKQAAASERKRRLDDQKHTLDGGGSVPLSDILRNIPGASDDSSPAASARTDHPG